MKPYLSWSQISMFQTCGERWRRRYLMGHKIPPAVAMILGTGTHASVERNMKSIIETREPITEEEVKDVARDAVLKRFEEEDLSFTEEEKQKGKGKVLAETIECAMDLGLVHRRVVAPKIRPAHSERRWKLELSGFPYDLTGVIDIQETAAADHRIIDVKTSGKSPQTDAAKLIDQLTMYALAVQTMDNLPNFPPLALDYLIKTKVPKHIRLDTTRTGQDVQRLVFRIEVMCEALEKQVFLPAPADSWQCSPRWCGYYETCKYPRGIRRPQS